MSNVSNVIGLLFLVGMIATGCDRNSHLEETADCDSRTGNAMSATVEGEVLCTDLGTALLSEISEPYLNVVGLFENGRSSISFDVDHPAVGTFDLARAMYGLESETAYHVDETEGSGSITITTLTDSRVEGTFEFTGVGYDVNGDRTGDQQTITNGRFEFVLTKTE